MDFGNNNTYINTNNNIENALEVLGGEGRTSNVRKISSVNSIEDE